MAQTVSHMVVEATAEVPGLSPIEAHHRVQVDPNTLVVDVRDSSDARAGGSIPGALNISYGDLLFAADHQVPENWSDPRGNAFRDHSRPIITQWVVGPLSAIAARTLKDMGFTNVSYIEGGIEAWKAAGLPTELPRDTEQG